MMKTRFHTYLFGLLGAALVAVLLFGLYALSGLLPDSSLGGNVCRADNTLGTLASALILQEALRLLFTKYPILNRISLDLTAEPVRIKNPKQGQKVVSRIHSIPPVNDFGTGASDVGDVDVEVTINQFKEIHRQFTYSEINATDRDLVREQAEPIAVALGKHMVSAIAAVWTAANFPEADGHETVEAVEDVAFSTFVALRQALINKGVDDRFAVVNPDVFAALLNDSTINDASKNPGVDAIQDGMITKVAGFKGIFEYPDLPTDDNMIGFAGAKDSVVMASRIPSDPREVLPNVPFPGVLVPLTHANGMTVLVNEYINQDTLAANVRIIFAYGVALGNVQCGQRLVSASTAA